ncbi:MFS transporter [Escherichia coli]
MPNCYLSYYWRCWHWLASMLSPMYIAELAPAHIRGKLVSFNQFAIILASCPFTA